MDNPQTRWKKCSENDYNINHQRSKLLLIYNCFDPTNITSQICNFTTLLRQCGDIPASHTSLRNKIYTPDANLALGTKAQGICMLHKPQQPKHKKCVNGTQEEREKKVSFEFHMCNTTEVILVSYDVNTDCNASCCCG